ncbi:MAG: diaminopimelate dehydrogenase [Spirochaetes bacterium]|jgi:diaminopimelate dehydrogenase|nr:diaminopimelate dehydrogenase [Spirochaetota bacterium]
MSKKIRIGILGYGNIGKGVEAAISQNSDMVLSGIFTRRDPSKIDSKAPVFSSDSLETFTEKIDVMILCGGSATDLPEQGPNTAALFNTVDSFDTHARVPEYFEKINIAAKKANTLSLYSCGWDPGLFSMMRVLFESMLPEGSETTFWGPGVSQGHSDAIRRIKGVADARQYTLPIDEAIDAARKGSAESFSTRQKHKRHCYVTVEEGADKDAITKTIVEMPNYFADYDTTVEFLDHETLLKEHGGIPHGGFVIRNGKTGANNSETMEFSLKLDSNPEFTASVLVACARAVHRMRANGNSGALSMLEVPLAYFSSTDISDLRAGKI